MKLTPSETWAQRLCVADLEDRPAEPIIRQIQADALRFAAFVAGEVESNDLAYDLGRKQAMQAILLKANQLHPLREGKEPLTPEEAAKKIVNHYGKSLDVLAD
jgi:hypothetical protein